MVQQEERRQEEGEGTPGATKDINGRQRGHHQVDTESQGERDRAERCRRREHQPNEE
jgi:hypothetical protein